MSIESVVTVLVGVLALLLLLIILLAAIRLSASRRTPHAGVVPQQRVRRLDEAHVELNRAYGERRIGEDEYRRRRAELDATN